MLEAKQMAQKLISRFQSNDPFKIADSLDYIVIFVPLRGIRGFHQYSDNVSRRYSCSGTIGAPASVVLLFLNARPVVSERSEFRRSVKEKAR